MTAGKLILSVVAGLLLWTVIFVVGNMLGCHLYSPAQAEHDTELFE